MLIEMLFFKITVTSTFIATALYWDWLYNHDHIRCDELLCCQDRLCCAVLERWSWW